MKGNKNPLNNILDQVKNSFGDESIMTLSDKPKANVDVISTGLMTLIVP